MDNYYPRSFFHPPFFSPYYYKNRNYYNQNILDNKQHESTNKKMELPKNEISYKKIQDSECSGLPIFELFGIELFFDDILLISLIFFLYSEGVQDQFLFIALILLLLS